MQLLAKKLTIYFGMLTLILSLLGCGSANSVCKVNYDSKKDLLEVTVLPPKESGEGLLRVGYEEKSSIIRNGKLTSTEITINRTITFKESGNSYHVTGTVDIAVKDKKGSLDKYKLTVSGGQYASTPFVCEK
jgi:hypothetical protein